MTLLTILEIHLFFDLLLSIKTVFPKHSKYVHIICTTFYHTETNHADSEM